MIDISKYFIDKAKYSLRYWQNEFKEAAEKGIGCEIHLQCFEVAEVAELLDLLRHILSSEDSANG